MARFKFMFWLDDSKQEQDELIGQVETLKENRLFSRTIRDGIKLITSLRDGSLDVLFELFPFVHTEFLKYVKDVIKDTDRANSPDLAIIEAAIERDYVARQADLERQASEQLTALETQNELLRDMLAKQDERIADLEQQLDKQAPAHVDFEALLNSVAHRIEQKLETVSVSAGHSPTARDTSSPGGLKPVTGASSSLKTLSVPTFDTPTYDDEDDIELGVQKDKTAGSKAVNNFLNSLSMVAQTQPINKTS